jgi:hypothetical protein
MPLFESFGRNKEGADAERVSAFCTGVLSLVDPSIFNTESCNVDEIFKNFIKYFLKMCLSDTYMDMDHL